MTPLQSTSFKYISHPNEEYIKVHVEIEQLGYLETSNLNVRIAEEVLKNSINFSGVENIEGLLREELQKYWKVYIELNSPELGFEILVTKLELEGNITFDAILYAFGKVFFNFLDIKFSESYINKHTHTFDNERFKINNITAERVSFRYNPQKKITSPSLKTIRFYKNNGMHGAEVDMHMWQIQSGRFIIDLPEEGVEKLTGYIWGLNYAYDIYCTETKQPIGIFLELISLYNSHGSLNELIAFSAAKALWELLDFTPKEDVYLDKNNPLFEYRDEGHATFPNAKEYPIRSNIRFHELFLNEQNLFQGRGESLTAKGMPNPFERMQMDDLINLNPKDFIRPVRNYIKRIQLNLEARLYKKKYLK